MPKVFVMQRLRHSLLSFMRIGYEATAAARVGTASTAGQHAAASLPMTLSRQQTTATVQQVRKLDSSDPNYIQQLKKVLTPENSGRKQFRRKWQKQLQIKVSCDPLFLVSGPCRQVLQH